MKGALGKLEFEATVIVVCPADMARASEVVGGEICLVDCKIWKASATEIDVDMVLCAGITRAGSLV
jgi:hypothetical protein